MPTSRQAVTGLAASPVLAFLPGTAQSMGRFDPVGNGGQAPVLTEATVVNALALGLIVGYVEAAYPALVGIVTGAVRPTPLVGKPAVQNTCAGPPPTDPRERTIWNTERR